MVITIVSAQAGKLWFSFIRDSDLVIRGLSYIKGELSHHFSRYQVSHLPEVLNSVAKLSTSGVRNLGSLQLLLAAFEMMNMKYPARGRT